MFCTPCLVVFPTHFSQLDLKPANLEYSKGRMNSGVSQTSLRIGTLLVQSKQQKRPLVYQSSQVYQDCTNSVPIVKNRQKIVKTAKKTIGVQSSQVYQDCTNSVPIVKTVKRQLKQQKMTIGVPIVTCLPRLYQQCTNRQKQSKTVKRQKMTIGVLIVTCLHRVRRIHKVRVHRPRPRPRPRPRSRPPNTQSQTQKNVKWPKIRRKFRSKILSRF